MTVATQNQVLFLLFSVTAAAGCSSGTLTTGPSQSVLVANATAFGVDSTGGGLVPPLPQGAECDPSLWTYTVQLDTSELVWDTCDVVGSYGDPASFRRSSGTKILPAADLGAARSVARMVHVSDSNSCGADKLTMHMTVHSPAGSKVYGDDFYACYEREDAYVVSAELDALVTYVRSLAVF